MPNNETLELKINSISGDATGIARTPRGVVFVHGALPGEIVKAGIVARKKDFSIADTIEIIKSSTGRAVPKCKYYGRCGGCQFQHADYKTQLEFKEKTHNEELRILSSLYHKLSYRFAQTRNLEQIQNFNSLNI